MGVKVEVLSAGRRDQALEEVRSGRMDLLLDTPMQVEQLTALDYIHPPLQLNEYLVWTRHDAQLTSMARRTWPGIRAACPSAHG